MSSWSLHVTVRRTLPRLDHHFANIVQVSGTASLPKPSSSSSEEALLRSKTFQPFART